MRFLSFWLLITLCALPDAEISAQRIVDPCFQSITTLGKFSGSEDLVNACPSCNHPFEAADMMEWDGTSWEGALPNSEIYLPPPPGCNIRAVWMGYRFWTNGGEAIGLRLDAPLIPGTEYTYTFTYASAGGTGDGNFSPKIYTNSSSDSETALYIGRLPGADGWTTNTITFTAKPSQAGHTWLFLHAFESSGMILGQCDLKQLYPDQTEILGQDIQACEGDRIDLTAPYTSSYAYEWSTGANEVSIQVTESGEYSVRILYGDCETSDTVNVALQDCEVRLVMPNVFTPNNDLYNERFVPKEHNFIRTGLTRVYNRWGKEIFTGDLFKGWDGHAGSGEAAPGIYYYVIDFTDRNQQKHLIKGYVTLLL